ncbi:hypothetical protein NRY95_20155 [Xanthomonas campestris pv. phormiicola]|nr:hypothetical protein [Xanthomonas campestris pv. phormiicola]UYC15970.1 hypothetical protein NRY95_20155 [Xanthomonas campestris pv. phormiicola]
MLDREGAVLLDLPGSDWADWDGGDLVFARHGCLYRLAKSDFRRYAQEGEQVFRLLHDFRRARFAPLAPSAQARKDRAAAPVLPGQSSFLPLRCRLNSMISRASSSSSA